MQYINAMSIYDGKAQPGAPHGAGFEKSQPGPARLGRGALKHARGAESRQRR
jgi:hypothetical protein